MLRPRVLLLMKLHRRWLVSPPVLFGDPASVPIPYGQSPTSRDPNTLHSKQPIENDPATEYHQGGNDHRKQAMRDISTSIAMLALVYLAIDNYMGRVQAERLAKETASINMKTLQLQQQSFVKEKKQLDLKMLKERMEVSKRSYKMALHIAMLKKQLQDLGATPVEAASAMDEFENSARVENSLRNLTGQAIWLAEDCQYKPFLPDYRDYDRKK